MIPCPQCIIDLTKRLQISNIFFIDNTKPLEFQVTFAYRQGLPSTDLKARITPLNNQPTDSITHLFPHGNMTQKPWLTLVIPALNEQLTIGEFVDWCHQGLKNANIDGQILIVDSSTDNTADIALAHGAEVLKVPKRGLGRAYIDAIPYIRGDYLIMGDADLTYDFRQLQPFVDAFRQGYDFVIGSRTKGRIEKGAMPRLHRYFGNPLTTGCLNILFGTRYTDIHCGMRGLSLLALKQMQLESPSWQYATEIVIKAKTLKLKQKEIPIDFFKDQYGRESHHLRVGWYSPWVAGLMTMKAMLKLRFSHLLTSRGRNAI